MGKSSLKRLFANCIASGVQMVTNKVASFIAVDAATNFSVICLAFLSESKLSDLRLDEIWAVLRILRSLK